MPRSGHMISPLNQAHQMLRLGVLPNALQQARLSIMAPKRKAASASAAEKAPEKKAAPKKAKAAPAPAASSGAADGKKLSLIIEACKS